ncbi:WD repeat domain 65 [Trypanosoma grayi]|uniref:WD repeat domain 65 n=1 Tax=Trypanosoma grayi TaxID=71804 RepID=UPI0004F4A2F7|nr:WD repeat domain 65 [Trypanosoma grayi]KEG08257.1 WD repeat domain 65 [Trypanosoma grayi]
MSSLEQKEGTGRSLVKRHVFGVKPDVYGCLNWVEEGSVIYPVGKTVAVHNLNTNTQRFFDAGIRSSGLTALAVSANKKFIAIAEAGIVPQVQIIDSVTRKRRKVLNVQDLGSDRFVALDFSADGRHLVTQGGGPQWKLFYWNWERSKPLAFTSVIADLFQEEDTLPGASVSASASGSRGKEQHGAAALTSPVSCATICPQDPLLIAVSGLGRIRFYRYVDGALQMQPSTGYPNERTNNFLTHAWITGERLVASTQSGELLLVEQGVYRRLLPVPPPTVAQSENSTVLTIVASKGGFVAGSDQGTIAIYENGDPQSDEYAIVYNVPLPLEDEGQVKGSASGNGATRGGVNTNATTTSSPTTTTTPQAASPTVSGAAAGPDAPAANPAVKSAKPLFQMNPSTPPRASAATLENMPETQARNESGRTEMRRANSVVRLALDHLEETMVLVTHGGQILGFNFSQSWAKRSIEDPPPMLPICQPFHVGGIIGVACSVRRPFLVTSGADKSVRIWNTNTHRLEMCQYFSTQPGPVAIHPNGLYVVICFHDRVRVMSILWNCLHEHRVLNLRNVTDVKYSVGGKYFALAHGNLIHIYNSLTCDVHGQLRGHPQKIHCFQWSATSPYPTDNGMVSCSLDGLIINWNISEMRKETEHADKRYQYHVIASDEKNIWAVGEPASAIADVQSKATLREMDRFITTETSGNSPNTTTEYEFRDNMITAILVAPKQRLLFGGMDDGSIKFMTFPLQVGVQDVPVVAHMSKVTRMALSYDESTVYTVSSDGALFIFDVREDGRTTQRETGYYGDEVLVLATDVEDREIAIESLTHMTAKLKTEIEGEEKRRNHEQNTRLRERADEFKSEVAALDAEYAALWNARAEQERSFVAVKMEKEAEAAPLLEDVEREGQGEVQALDDLCTELQRTLDGSKDKYAQEVQDLEEQIDRDRREDEERFNDVVAKRRKGLEKLERQLQRAKENNVESRRRLELDTDAELYSIQQRNKRELDAIRERYLHMKGEGAIMRKNAVRMEKEAEVHTNELHILESAKTALTTQLGELNQRMTQLHQDIESRDVVIGEKEKRIYDLKKLNQELEKHKFVLDYRIRQLKSQMEPRQREIAREHKRISEKNTELENLHQSNITLRQSIEELKADLTQQQVQIKQTLNHMKDFETYKSRVKTDVGELAPAMQDPAQLREVVERLYQRHVVARDGHRAAQVDQEIKDEFRSQLEYLSTSFEALRRKCKSDQEQHRCEVSTMMMENLALIREIHELRSETAELRNLSVAAADEAKRRNRMEQGNKSVVASSRGNPLSSSGALGAKRPEPPRELENNRTEIRQLRAFIEATQHALAATAATTTAAGEASLRHTPSSCSLPPIK